MLKNIEMLIRSVELTPMRNLNFQRRKAELSKECGAELILILAPILSVILRNPCFSLGNN